MNLAPQVAAVIRALGLVDEPGTEVDTQLDAKTKGLVEAVLSSNKNASDKVALLYLLSYKREAPDWHLQKVPVGWRPQDKVLAEGLTDRNLTLHENITSPGENMGIKGDASRFDLFKRPRLGEVLAHIQENPNWLDPALRYVAKRFRDSYAKPAEAARLDPNELIYTRALVIANRLIDEESGGFYPQFLVAGILQAFHEQLGTNATVRTAHPNASDKSGGMAGDVEVVGAGGEVEEAFEVTVRPDWRNRRADLLKKMHAHGLPRYNVVCILSPDLEDPDALHEYMGQLGQDIAVVDIRQFVAVMFQLLDREHRRRALRYLEEHVRNRELCGRPDLIARLAEILESE